MNLLLSGSRLGVDHGGCSQGNQGEKNRPHFTSPCYGTTSLMRAEQSLGRAPEQLSGSLQDVADDGRRDERCAFSHLLVGGITKPMISYHPRY
jgi:hypothetical protein